jgi:ABC-2 type transport system ATP-binding protein
MSVVVYQLTKIYGTQKALDTVSFEAPKGAITGFLGPNGAGKSTTMKIATGYLTPSSGSILVNDIDVTVEPLMVKKITGYLPENNPLYLDMYVKQYLKFVASAYELKGIPNRISKMIGLCGLEKEQAKKISALSKGYRQRVGLAQALIHDPEVLILDEPTSGLDPNQLVDIREVIKSVSEEKTVILSTHIMQEVEALCDKVVIIDKGKIVADDKVKNLKKANDESEYFLVEFEDEIDVEYFKAKNLTIESLEKNCYLISGSDDIRKIIMQVIGEHSLPLSSISKKEQSLEQVFHDLTKEK